ncbi:hypothetical protein M0R45_026241 [Rubus argutus]|uniref:Uncharacterized protein n=1 Tax=Rubus argutus TaxID=59490 RepID=A0AAW1WYQ8_RUBAR
MKEAKVNHSSNPWAIMGSDLSSDLLDTSGPDPDFAFAFNGNSFSDRLLRIEIVPDISETKLNGMKKVFMFMRQNCFV